MVFVRYTYSRPWFTGAGLICLLVGLLLALQLMQPLAAVAGQEFTPLKHPPAGEQWFGIYFNDERVGFVRLAISEVSNGYCLESLNAVKMEGLGFSRDAVVRERYLVGPTLALRSFTVDQTIDGVATSLTGQVSATAITLSQTANGTTVGKTIAVNGPVYPPPALNIYPLFQQVSIGRKHRLTLFDPETPAVKTVRITVRGFGQSDGRSTVLLRNDLYPFVSNDIHVTTTGATLLESVRDGWIETRAESAAVARQLLVEAAITRHPLLHGLELIPPDRLLERADATITALTVDLGGFPQAMPLRAGFLQQAERLNGTTVRFRLAAPQVPATDTPIAREPAAELRPYLAGSQELPVDDPDIRRQAAAIVGEAPQAVPAVTGLARWVADQLEEGGNVVQSALDALKHRSGTSLCHARLYAALARSVGIPTRVVSGLVAFPGQGFRFRSWAESYVGTWLPVDPVSGQIPAGAVYLALVEGDTMADLAPLADLIGSLGVTVVDVTY